MYQKQSELENILMDEIRRIKDLNIRDKESRDELERGKTMAMLAATVIQKTNQNIRLQMMQGKQINLIEND